MGVCESVVELDFCGEQDPIVGKNRNDGVDAKVRFATGVRPRITVRTLLHLSKKRRTNCSYPGRTGFLRRPHSSRFLGRGARRAALLRGEYNVMSCPRGNAELVATLYRLAMPMTSRHPPLPRLTGPTLVYDEFPHYPHIICFISGTPYLHFRRPPDLFVLLLLLLLFVFFTH